MLRSLFKEIAARGSTTRDHDRLPTPDPAIQARWIDGLILRIYQLMHTFEQDNFDPERYRNVPENAFFAERHAAYFSFLLNNVEHFFRSRQLLDDEPSRALYDELILFRVLGHLHVRLPFNTP